MPKSKKMKAAAIFVSLAAFGGSIPGVAGAQSDERVDCTVRTARQMTSIEDICVCNVYELCLSSRHRTPMVAGKERL